MSKPRFYLLSKLYIVIISAIALLPNLYVVILGIEDFPFTCAPMFAHYIGPQTNLYVFKFEGVKDHNRELIGPYENGRPEPVFMRQFFCNAYGSKDPISPFGYHPKDSLEIFKLRMDKYFGLYWEFLSEKRKKSYDRIELTLDKVDQSGGRLGSYLLGHFDVKKQIYFHSPQKLENR